VLPSLTHPDYFETPVARAGRGGAGIASLIAALVVGVALVAAWAGAAVPGRATAARPGGTTLPLTARGPVSAALGRQQSAYRIAGLRARNRVQRLGATFAPGGVTIASGAASARLRLAAFGHGAALRPVESVAPRVRANRVDYAHAGVREWWANGPLGLEQGFDLPARPAGEHGPLTLSLGVSGDLRARRTGAGVTLAGKGAALRYGSLSATDARGRTLPAQLDVRGGRLQIRVDDRHAAYPVRVDPFVTQARLTASDGVAGDGLGTGLAVSDDTIAVGAGFDDVSANKDQGAVYVFSKPATGWVDATQTAILTASDGAAGDGLSAVAISGDTIVAGGSEHKIGTNTEQGAAYVFVKPPGAWHDANQTAELTAADGAENNSFGSDVGISGDTVVVSAPGKTVGTHFQQGAGYVFVKPAGGWKDATQTAELTASDGGAQDALGLGNGVGISGDTIVLGADMHDVGTNQDEGAAYVYFKPVGGWKDMMQSSELEPSDGGAGDLFGFAVGIDGPTIAVGSVHHQVGLSKQGAAYVFANPTFFGLQETQTAELTASDGVNDDRFGAQLAVAGNTVLVGSLLHQVGSNVGQGAAYVFTRPGPVWRNTTETQELTAPDGAAGDGFADAVAMAGDTSVASAPLHKVGANEAQGQVYVFGPAPPPVAQSGGSPGGGGGGPSAAPSTTPSMTLPSASATATAPALSRVKQSARVWRAGHKLASIARSPRRPVGTTFSFTLDQPATVALRFSGKGRRARGGTLTLRGHQGTNTVAFAGRVARRRTLRPGRWTVRITATNAAGQRTTARPLGFRIVR